MKKIDPTVRKETLYVSLIVLILSALMEAVAIAISQWSFSFLWGNLLGALGAVANFLLMGITVQNALKKTDEKQMRNFVKLSQGLRMLMILVVAVIGCVSPLFHPVATLLPFLFPRIAVTLRGLQMKK